MHYLIAVGVIVYIVLTNREIAKAEIEENEFCREYERESED